MVDLFFYKKVEDVEAQAIEEKGDEKAFARDEKWDKQEEEGAAEGEEQWTA